MARKSRSKQRSKGAGTRSSKAKSSGKSSNSRGSGTGGGASGSKGGGSKSGGSKSKSSSKSSNSSSKGPGGGKSPSSNTRQSSPPAQSPAPKKTLTPVQQRFKEREAKGLDGLTGMRKVTDAERKQGVTQLTQYRAAQQKQVQDAAKIRNAAFQAERDVKSGQVPGQGGAMSAEARAAAAKQLAAKQAADAAAKKAAEAEATRVRRFDPNRLSSTFSTSFTQNPLTSNNYFNLGKNIRVPNEDTASFRKLFADDRAQITRTDKAFKEGATGIKGANPFKAFTPNMLKTGPTALARQAATRFLPSSVRNISLGSTIFNEGRSDSATTQALNSVGNINIGGLSIGPRSDESTDIGAQAGRFFQSIPGRVVNAFGGGDETKVASTDAGGLNIGGGVDSEGGSSTGRTVVTTDRDKNINYDVGGIARDVALGSLDKITANRFDFDNLGRPGDDTTVEQKISTLKKSPLQQAVLSKQLGVDANRIINEGGAAAENLMKNYVSQIDASSAKGIRNPIARLFRDTAGENQTDATAMAGRAMSAFSVDDPNFSNDPNKLTQMLKFAGVPQLSEENVQDIRHTMNTNVTEDTGIAGKGLTNIPYSQAFGLANRITSGKIKDGVEESMNQLGMNNVPSLNDAVALGAQYGTNMNTEGTVTAKRMGELNSLYQKYGPGGGQAPTIPSIIKGIGGAVGRSGGSGSPMQIQGGGGMTATLPTAVPQQQQLPLPLITQQTGVGAGNLQNIQQNAYNNQMNMYASNPNYFAQFRPQRRFPRRGGFRSAFSRDYFN